MPRGPGEQVGLALATAGDGVAQRPHDVVLPLQLGEAARPVAAVQRRRGHRAEPTEGVSAARRRRAGVAGGAVRSRLVVQLPCSDGAARTGVPGRTLRLVVGRAGGRVRSALLAVRRRGCRPAHAQNARGDRPRPTVPILDRTARADRARFDEPIGSANRRPGRVQRQPVHRPRASRRCGDDGLTFTVDDRRSRMPAGTCTLSWQVSEPDRRGRGVRRASASRSGRPSTTPARPPCPAATADATTVGTAGRPTRRRGRRRLGGSERRRPGSAGCCRLRGRRAVRLARADRRRVARGPRVHPRRALPARRSGCSASSARCSTSSPSRAAVNDESFGSGLNPAGWLDLLDAGWAGRAAVARLVLVRRLAVGWCCGRSG